MRKRSLLLLFTSLLFSRQSYPRQDWVICGTHQEKVKEELHLHRQAVKLRPQPPFQALSRTPSAGDIGNIAVIDDLGVVSHRNLFDLDQQTVTFQPATPDAARYRFQVADGGYDGAAASAGMQIQGFQDDDTRQIPLPFSFPFYGNSYQQIFVNSDGNLTFGAGDTATGERSLGRMTAGPPRISPLFRDLDPSRSSQGVVVVSEAGRFVVSWLQVPEFQEFGFAPIQTFQVRLFPDGRIEFSYAGIGTQSAVVGISPGERQGSTAVVSFSDGSSEEFSATIAETFSAEADEVDIVAAAQKFYETHDDAYDYLVIFNNLGISAGDGALAFEVTVRNDRTGFGEDILDFGQDFGSGNRLQAVMNMGPLSQYPADTSAPVGNRGTITGDTPLTVLGHEAGHLFLAFASVRDPQNPVARPMLGAGDAHWSFNFNSDASLLEGNRIRDDGVGAVPRYTTIATNEGFSALDQYLMGLRAPAEVTPPHELFLVTDTNHSPSRFPQVGITFSGERRDILIDEIIQAEGRRTPDHTVSQQRYRLAFILVAAAGTNPSQEELNKLDTFRREFEAFYHAATSDRAWADTSLRRSLRLSTFPAAGVLVGGSLTASLSIEQPASNPLTVTLDTPNGAASAPASVTIPAGATSVTFQINGTMAGVEELAARPDDAAYATAYSRVQVLDSLSGLRLSLVSGDEQGALPGTPLPEPIVLRVADINNLPYQGLSVQASVSDGGTVSSPVATSDPNGLVRFNWTPGAGPDHRLTATLEGAPASSSLTVVLLSAPLFAAAGVVNAASFAPGISPGTFVSIFGTGLAAGAQTSALPPYPLSLANVQVLLNGEAVPLHFVSDLQINFLVPLDTPEGPVDLVVSTRIGSSTAVQVQVVTASPGIFFDPETGFGSILVHSTGQTIAQRPAQRGEFLEIFATGLGAVRPSPIPGLHETVLTPVVLLNGSLPLPISFSGLAPGFPGLYQINAQISDPAPSGEQMLLVEIGGVRSNQVKIQIE